MLDSDPEQVQFTEAELLGTAREQILGEGREIVTTTAITQQLTNRQIKAQTQKYLQNEKIPKGENIVAMLNSFFSILQYQLNRYPCILVSRESVLEAVEHLNINEDDFGLDSQVILQVLFDYLQMGLSIDKTSYSSLCNYDYGKSVLLKQLAHRVSEASFAQFANSWERIDYFTETLYEFRIAQWLLDSLRYSLDSNHTNTNWFLYGLNILSESFGFIQYIADKNHLWSDKSNNNGIWDEIFAKDKNNTRSGDNLVVLRQFRYVCSHIFSILSGDMTDQKGAILIQSIHDLYEFSSNINWVNLHEMIVGISLHVSRLDNAPNEQYFHRLCNLIGTIARAVRDLALLAAMNVDKLETEPEYVILEMWAVLVLVALTTIYEATSYLEKEYATIDLLYGRLNAVYGVGSMFL